MKKIAGLAVLAVSVAIGICLIFFWDRPIYYSQCIISTQQFEDIIVERARADGLLDALYFNEELLLLDPQNRTFYYSLIEGSPGSYDPGIKIAGENTGLEIAFLTEKITEDGIRNNQQITFLAYTEDEYCEYYLKCTTLPLMSIECPGIAHMEEITEEDIPMRVTLFDNRQGATGRVLLSDGMIRVRGASTTAYPKKGYRISLTQDSIGGSLRSNNVSLLGMRQDDDWLLYAGYNDQEKIRNVFSSNLWQYTCATDNADGINTGTEYCYLELFINHEYCGLYALGYPLDRKQLQMGTDSSREALYKFYGWVYERALSYTEDGAIVGIETKGTPDGLEDVTLFREYFDNLAHDYSDNQKLYAGIDIDNVIDTYLFLNLIQGLDNTSDCWIKNMYLVLQSEQERLTALYAPWDLDITWGNVWTNNLDINYTLPYHMSADANRIMQSGYLNQLLVNEDSLIWDKIFEKYQKLRLDGWSDDNINALLDAYEADIYGSGAYLRDMERWPGGSYADASDGLNTFRAYVKQRLQETDLYYQRLEPLRDESIFIQRSAQYKDFLNWRFVIEINNKELLTNPDYVDLFTYIGVDRTSITDDVRFIIADPKEGIYVYYSLISQYQECFGTSESAFRFIPDTNVYRLYLDDEPYCEIPPTPDIYMILLKDNRYEVFNFEKGYETPPSSVDNLIRLKYYLFDMMAADYNAIVEINNLGIWENASYTALFESLGAPDGTINESTDFIVLNSSEKTAIVLDNFHTSGSRSDTPMGGLSLFVNEEGVYGIYLNNNECFVGLQTENAETDIRVILLDPETNEVVTTVTFTSG